VLGSERSLTVDAATADKRRNPCPATQKLADRLVRNFVR
jgi:hypothetical protein